MSLRLVMLGTGQFALPTFLRLDESNHEVVALFTQPDRTGHGHHRHSQPMKEMALPHGTPIFQPENVNTSESLAQLRKLDADLFVVAAYGQILSEDLLKIPRRGAVNVHASLLPRHRGAAPVQYAILRGDDETGVTIFRIEPRLDAGPILGVVRTAIGDTETSGQLEARLAELAAPLTLDVVDRISAGIVEETPQDASQVTRAPRIRKALGAIDWSGSARDIERHVRAMQPWPNAFTFLRQPDGKALRLIVLAAQACESDSGGEPAGIVVADGGRLVVSTGEGGIDILRLRPEGKGDMTAAEFLRGHSVGPGDHMTASPAEN